MNVFLIIFGTLLLSVSCTALACSDVTPTPKTSYSVCSDNCQIITCDSKGAQAKINDCPKTALNCATAADNKGSCSPTSTSKDTSCSVFKQRFTCQHAIGSFPDPLDCRAYYVCGWNSDRTEILSVRRTCASNQVFYEATSACLTTPNAALCKTIDCTVTMGNGVYSPYGTSTKNFALCAGDGTIKMFQCATGATFDKTPAVSDCVYKCPTTGKFAYSLDNTKYFNCVKVNGKITATIESCADVTAGSIFVVKAKDCGFPAALSLSNNVTVLPSQ